MGPLLAPEQACAADRSWTDSLAQTSRENHFDGVGWVASADRAVRCSSDPEGYRLVVDDVAEFSMSADGSEVVVNAAHDVEPLRLMEALFGPAMLIALALAGKFCLHASAICKEGRLVAFFGESGAGKSTLADLLSRGEHAWSLAGDDLLVFGREDGCYWAYPHYPQPNLGARQTLLDRLPERVPIDRICKLAEPSCQEDPIELVAFPARVALTELSRQSVASRLFDRLLLKRHFDCLAGLAGEIEIAELRYPRSHDVGPAISRLLA